MNQNMTTQLKALFASFFYFFGRDRELACDLYVFSAPGDFRGRCPFSLSLLYPLVSMSQAGGTSHKKVKCVISFANHSLSFNNTEKKISIQWSMTVLCHLN